MNTRTTLFGTILGGALLIGALAPATAILPFTDLGPVDENDPGFLTTAPAYVDLATGVEGHVKPLITTGDTIGDYRFAGIPDGIGVVVGLDGIETFVNHEYNPTSPPFSDALVSRLVLNPVTGSILEASTPVADGMGYRRLCSASEIQGYGFLNSVFLSGEEVDDGVAFALDTVTGEITDLPWLGELSHENQIILPHAFLLGGKVAVLVLEDGPATESEVYLYVADTAQDFLAGHGQLYVLSVDDPSITQWDDLYHATGSVSASFIPLDWDWETQDHLALDEEAIAKGGFQFVRVEDAATDKRPTSVNRVYFADTGNDRDENGLLIPPGANGQGWIRGRIYELAFDPLDLTRAQLRVMLDGDDATAPGFGVMSNPDNVDTGLGSLMIQEDRIGPTRALVDPLVPYDVTKNAKIIRYALDTGELQTVAYVNQVTDHVARYGDWESSGIHDASPLYGPGTWLVDVQAHSLDARAGVPEGANGQLLLLQVAGS